jgi:hypothetical protein
MQNYAKQEKSKGVVLFAFNTDIDYVGIADSAARLINHYLQLPVTLITDLDSEPSDVYDQVVRVEPKSGNTRLNQDLQTVEWRNFGRYLAYELSPYDTTILLDTDYLVLDDSLLKLLSTEHDYLLQYHNTTDRGACYEQMGETSLPFVWATAVVFRKTPRTKMLFNLVGRIQRNYNYYRALYNIREGNYRNDYAFAIANNILNGYCIDTANSIPWPMLTIEDRIESIPAVTDNFLHVRLQDRAVVVPRQNIHVMDKQYLLSDEFKQLVEKLCESA